MMSEVKHCDAGVTGSEGVEAVDVVEWQERLRAERRGTLTALELKFDG